ncbi:hypothetical protein DBV15_07467 [Temnothorax longispinosus]|uniref:Uncharacterized protein n=1 Tax=Temnothorax longispinosus TaxID=300112 RepID=A0A4S2KKN6_9HYME|nr:hypothetical protein DBV15_07467 [Temnothorax longispinosus]
MPGYCLSRESLKRWESRARPVGGERVSLAFFQRQANRKVEMLLLGPDHLLRGGLADGLGEALAGDAVPCGQQPVVDRLSRHTVPLSRWLAEQSVGDVHDEIRVDPPRHVRASPPPRTGRRDDKRSRDDRDEDENEDDGRERRVKLAVLDATRTDGRERDTTGYGHSG